MPDSVARLAFLIGSFSGVEQMHPSAWAPGGPATSSIEADYELGGSLVLQRYVQTRDGSVSFEGLAVWMVDPASGETLYYGFDSAGFPADPPARGTWQDADLVLTRTTPRGSSRLTVTPGSSGWRWSREFQAPDSPTWAPVFDSTFSPAGSPLGEAAVPGRPHR